MKCKSCGIGIPSGTEVNWQGFSYHSGCIGAVVAQHRAKTEVPSSEHSLPDDYFAQLENSMEDDQFFEDEITRYEEDDDLEDTINRLDEVNGDVPYVSDDILNQIPPTSDPISFPPNSHIIGSTTLSPPVGTLISGRETSLVSRDFLKTLPTPQATDTFKPIPHIQLVEEIHKSLSYRRLEVVREEYAVSPDGMKCFGLIELNVEYAGVRFAIGLRNANDKSMRVGLVAGYRVTVCENKMLTGDFKPLLAKHSKNFNLIEGLSIALDKIHRGIGEVNQQIERKRISFLTEEKAMNLIYQAFMVKKLPVSLMRTVHNEFFVKPSYKEFSEKTVWSLENAFTTGFKKLKPIQQFEATAKLGNLISQNLPVLPA